MQWTDDKGGSNMYSSNNYPTCYCHIMTTAAYHHRIRIDVPSCVWFFFYDSFIQSSMDIEHHMFLCCTNVVLAVTFLINL